MKMKKQFAILVLAVFILAMLPAVSAISIDYSNEDMTAHIKDTILWGLINTGEQGTMELKSHKSVNEVLEVGLGWQLTMYYDTNFGQTHNDALGEVSFIDMRTGEEIKKEWKYVYWGEEEYESPIYKTIESISENGTIIYEPIQTGTETLIRNKWIDYNSKDLPKGQIRIGIMVNNKQGDYIDGIWEVQGKEIKKHASWLSSLDTDLISYYKLDESSGTVLDAVGSNDGTNNGATPNVAGKINTAYDFDGTNDYIALTDIDGIKSVNFWFNIDWTDDESYAEILNNGYGEGIQIRRWSTEDVINVDFYISSTRYRMESGAVISSGWHMATFTHDGTTGKLYIDGSSYDSISASGTIDNTNNNWEIGRRNGLNDDWLKGKIDEVGIWSRALTSTEITNLYNGGDGNSYPTTPKVTLNSPADSISFEPNAEITFNATISDNTPVNVSIYFNNILNETNTSGVLGDYIFTKSFSSGEYNWTIEACNTNGCNNETRFFDIDTIPFISVLSPLNQTYNTSIYFNATSSISTTDNWTVNYNGTNITIPNINYLVDVGDGFHHLLLYAINNLTDEWGLNDSIYFSVDTTIPILNLTSPNETFNYLYPNYNLTLNFTATDINLDTCWYNYNETDNIINCSTGILNSTTFNYQKDKNNLTVYVNDTHGNIVNETVSWNYLIFDEQEYTYETEVVESETQIIKGKFKVPGDVENVYLRYNGDLYTVSINALADSTYEFYSTLIAPAVPADINKTFNFVINGINTANITQLIQSVNIDNCGVYTNEILNLTLEDEEIFTSLTGKIYVNFQVIDGSDNVIADYQNKDDSGHSIKFCSNINLTDTNLYLNAEIEYETANYSREFYHIQKGALSNYPRVLYLYNIKLEDSTKFKILYQSLDLTKVPNAVVQLQRKYTYLDEYKIVEAPLTSSDSEAIIHVDTDSVKYKITIAKDGEIISTFDNLVFQCDNELYGICEQKLLEPIIPVNLVNLENLNDFQYSITTNKTTKKVQVDFATPSTTPREVNMIVFHKTITGTSTICNKTTTSSAGSLICNYEDTIEDSNLILFVYLDGNLLVQKGYKITEDLSDYFNGNNFLIVFIIGLSLIFMSMSSPEWIILNSVLTIVASGALWLINGMDLVIGIGSLIWVIGAGLILILKTSKQEDN